MPQRKKEHFDRQVLEALRKAKGWWWSVLLGADGSGLMLILHTKNGKKALK